MVTKIKIINIYHRVSKIHKKRKRKKKKMWFSVRFHRIFERLHCLSIVERGSIENHRDTYTRKFGKEGRKRMVGSPYPFVCEEITFVSRAFVSSNREGIYKMRTTSFDIFSMLVKFDSTCFVFFFFFKGENRLYLPFSFDDFAIKLNTDPAKKGI